MRIRLRDNVQTAIEMAMIDPLTGLNNRRYLESHLATLLDQAAHRGRPLSLMILDSITSKPSTTPTATMPAMKS
jgi:PleD family two-component response regulator